MNASVDPGLMTGRVGDLGTGRDVDTCFGTGAKSRHPSIHEGMGTASATKMLALRAMGQRVVPRHQLQGGLTAVRVEGSRALVHRDPPFFIHSHLLFAADVTSKTLNPSHRVLCHPVKKCRYDQSSRRIFCSCVPGRLRPILFRGRSGPGLQRGSPAGSRQRQASSGYDHALTLMDGRIKTDATHPLHRTRGFSA